MKKRDPIPPGRLTDAVPNPFGSKLYSARIAFWSTEAPNMQEDRVGLFRPKMQHPQGMAGSARIPRTWPDAKKRLMSPQDIREIKRDRENRVKKIEEGVARCMRNAQGEKRVEAICRTGRWHLNRQAAIRSGIILVKALVLEVRLGHLIRCPADGGTRHGGDNARAHAAQETAPAEAVLDDGGRVPQAACRADFFTFGQTTSLEKGLHHVERSGDTGREGTSKTTCHAVGEGIVVSLGVHNLGDRLVGNELGRSEGHGHAESCRVGEVEGLKTLSSVKGFGTLHHGLVNGAVDLHSLLDDCFREGVRSSVL